MIPMMFLRCAVLLVCLSWSCSGTDPYDDFLYDVFPDDFLWSSATSSYQIEGAWAADGKGENIWDTWCHAGNRVAFNHTGDVACDSYNHIEEDVAMLVEMGVDMYRFSLSWARILPTGRLPVNEAGVDYYIRLIDALIAAGIEPVATLYHWDLPQDIQDEFDGWLDEQIVEPFVEYSRVAFERFGDKVKWWITFNEPWIIALMGHEWGSFPPGVNDQPGTGGYIVTHNLIKAHAQTWHLYDTEFRPTQNGFISITLNTDWLEPADDDPANIEAAYRAIQFSLGWFAHPIFIDGDYPQVMKDQISRKSEEQGFNASRLPEFTEEEKELNKGTWDFFGLNHYTTTLIEDNPRETEPGYNEDQDTVGYKNESWPGSGSSWLQVVPWGLRKLLNHIRDEYNNPPVLITENGVSDKNGTLDDAHRISYYRDYINNVLKAVKLDNCSVIGYTAWSLMDNFEWGAGYTEKFGLFNVDFEDPDRPRTAKDSANWYAQLIRDNGFPPPGNQTVQ